MYTLADAINPETGWGLAGETWRVMESLGRLGRRHLVQPRRPGPGHPLYRTQRLSEGAALGDGHRRAGRALRRGHPTPAGHRRPAAHPAAAGRRGRGRLPGVLRQAPPRRGRGGGPVRGGRRRPTRARACSRRSTGADAVVVCPSNPVVSIDPLLAVPGVAEALAAAPGRHRRRLPHRGRGRAQGTGRPAPRRDGVRVLGGRAWPAGTRPGCPRWSSTRPTPHLAAGGRGRGGPLCGRPDDHVRRRTGRPRWPGWCSMPRA